MDDEDKQSVENPITNEAFIEALRKCAKNLEKRAAEEPSESLPNSSSIYCDASGLAELFTDLSNKIDTLSKSLIEFKNSLDKALTFLNKA